MVRCKYFSHIFNINCLSEIRPVEIHTAEPLEPEPSALEVELATEKLKSHQPPRIYQILSGMIKARGRPIRCANRKLIIAIWNKEDSLKNGRNQSWYLQKRRGIKPILIPKWAIQYCQLHKKFYPKYCCCG
jgi:hypothetical protein